MQPSCSQSLGSRRLSRSLMRLCRRSRAPALDRCFVRQRQRSHLYSGRDYSRRRRRGQPDHRCLDEERRRHRYRPAEPRRRLLRPRGQLRARALRRRWLYLTLLVVLAGERHDLESNFHLAYHDLDGGRPGNGHDLLHKGCGAERDQRRPLLHGLSHGQCDPVHAHRGAAAGRRHLHGPQQASLLRPARRQHQSHGRPRQHLDDYASQHHQRQPGQRSRHAHGDVAQRRSDAAGGLRQAGRHRHLLHISRYPNYFLAAVHGCCISEHLEPGLDSGRRFEPGILNPGETAQIEIDLGTAVEAGKTNLIVIGSEAGSTISMPFTS